MTSYSEPLRIVETPAATDGRRGLLYGLAMSLLAVNVFVAVQFGSYISELNNLRGEFSDYRKATLEKVNRIGHQAVATSETAAKSVNSLQTELDATRKAIESKAGEMQREAIQRVDSIASRIAQEQQRQDHAEQRLRSELSRVQEEAHSRIGEVSAEVGTVKSQVAASRLAMERTVAALRRVNGELGVQSGLIATNHRELDALKSVGDKNYFEFNLGRARQDTKVADVALLLKKVDARRGRFTVEIVNGEKRMEKRDRTLNEPLQFYVSKVKGPYEKVEDEMYEVVVNEIRKDRVIGYLSTPRSR